MEKFIKWGMISVFALLLLQCSSPGTKATLALKQIALLGEGPLFEGANTLQAGVQPGLEAWLKQQGKTMKQVKEIKLTEARIYTTDTADASQLRSLVLQLAGQQADMVKVGVLNPLPAGITTFDLQVSQETDCTDLLKLNELFVVADAELTTDREANLSLNADLIFTVTLK